ncbi:MAG: hypothetical protein KGL95_00345 [Patescibacteria group bacterium]|nr:hypothetical protein [Patescibacteria group bacterium]
MDEKIAQDIIWLRLAQMIVNDEYKAGKFKIPIHLSFGHEAIAVAISHLMESDDLLILSHRNIAYNLARLRLLRPILNEYYLRSDGLMGGRLGSMNLINPQKGIIYSSSILGNNFSVATGVSMAQKMLRPDRLTIVLGGDGSIEEGTFHESLIMFKTLNLNTIILIENNEWSMSTHINERRCPIDLEKLASSYDIKYMKLEGNDPYVYLENLRKLKNFALGGMPVCVEVTVSTLGDWRMKTPEFPLGKFVNYHAGPAPDIELKNWPLTLKTNQEDPIFVLNKYFNSSVLEEMAETMRGELNRELA